MDSMLDVIVTPEQLADLQELYHKIKDEKVQVGIQVRPEGMEEYADTIKKLFLQLLVLANDKKMEIM